MPSKNVYRVGTDGTANYATLAAIPAEILTQGDTSILVYPGNYTALTDMVASDVAFVGVGDREEIVINGGMTIANTSSGVVSFENINFIGSNAAVAAAAACVTKLGIAATPLHFKNVAFSNAKHAVVSHATLAQAAGVQQVVLNYSDASAVDQAIVANANVGIGWSALNSSANAYYQVGAGGAGATVTLRASTSGGANTGNTVKTVVALIS